METLTFEQKLQRYADLTVKVGLNLQPGQRLIIYAEQLEVAPMVRAVTESAYKHGCRLVTVHWIDAELSKIRYQYAPRDSFEEVTFLPNTANDIARVFEEGTASLKITAEDPGLLKGVDPELIATSVRAENKFITPRRVALQKNTVNGSIIVPPTPGWAASVFPDKSPQEALDQLWEAVFKTVRVDEPDPVAFWEGQVINLTKRSEYLNAKRYTGLHYTAPGTDLTVGLPDGHDWHCAGHKTQNGITCLSNFPTEEVYTLPHKDRTEGTVTATKPLSLRGNLVENFSLTFSEGKVVKISAEKGEDILRGLLDTDENSSRLGEVALVPHKTPISQMNLVFLNTLYDENASNHLALGAAYPGTLKGGVDMSDEEFAKAGGNISISHVDFMFGSGEMNVDGLLADGTSEPVMRNGEWAFDV